MKNRPEPVRLICLLSLLSIPLFMLMAVAFWAFGAAGDAVALQVMGAVILAVAVAQVVITWGF